jgi:ABC-type Fe3+/spermidine/putrescine transport system ATPase subunit
VLLPYGPLSKLNAHLRIKMRDLIRGIQSVMGITPIFVTHDQEEALVLDDRVILIPDGHLRQFDAPDAFYRRPAGPGVAAFFGGHNVLSGHSSDGIFNGSLSAITRFDWARMGPGPLTLRPKAVRIGAASVNRLQAQMAKCHYLGTRTLLRLIVGGTAVDAVLPPHVVDGIGRSEMITINLPPGSR